MFEYWSRKLYYLHVLKSEDSDIETIADLRANVLRDALTR